MNMLNEITFWQIIEDAWKCVEVADKSRKTMVASGTTPDLLAELNEALNHEVMPKIEEILQGVDKPSLIAFDHILERKLYDLDRQDVQEYIEGSDDGFLYARGFVLGLGKEFYDQINVKPYLATQDQFMWYDLSLGCPEICFVAQELMQQKYNEAIPETNISRESYSNEVGWSEV